MIPLFYIELTTNQKCYLPIPPFSVIMALKDLVSPELHCLKAEAPRCAKSTVFHWVVICARNGIQTLSEAGGQKSEMQ